jgi:hypothetical protein
MAKIICSLYCSRELYEVYRVTNVPDLQVKIELSAGLSAASAVKNSSGSYSRQNYYFDVKTGHCLSHLSSVRLEIKSQSALYYPNSEFDNIHLVWPQPLSLKLTIVRWKSR